MVLIVDLHPQLRILRVKQRGNLQKEPQKRLQQRHNKEQRIRELLSQRCFLGQPNEFDADECAHLRVRGGQQQLVDRSQREHDHSPVEAHRQH